MNINDFLKQLKQSPDTVNFNQTISTVDENYNFTPSEFKNGDLVNAVNQNNGSCKIFAFAKLHELPEDLTLHCFGDYYRKDVLENPDGDDHQNIRNFMKSGWSGITFETAALNAK